MCAAAEIADHPNTCWKSCMKMMKRAVHHKKGNKEIPIKMLKLG
jgi:hypothetical protein